MAAVKQDFEMVRGDTKVLVFFVKGPDGLALPLTGATVKWEAATSVHSETKDIAKSTAVGGVAIADADAGHVRVTLSPSDTSGLLLGRRYHELEVTQSSGEVSTVSSGTMTLKPGLV